MAVARGMSLLISRSDVLKTTWKSSFYYLEVKYLEDVLKTTWNGGKELHESRFLIAALFPVEHHVLLVSKLKVKILANAQPHCKCSVISKVE